jgi:hypothetical protein
VSGRSGRLGLVKVASARNQAEAEFIQSLLREEGLPSMTRRSAGFDVPDFLAAGPRDVLVPERAEIQAREVLMEAELIEAGPQQAPAPPASLHVWLLVAIAAAAAVVWIVLALVV